MKKLIIQTKKSVSSNYVLIKLTTAKLTETCDIIFTTRSARLSIVDPLLSTVSGARKADRHVEGSFLQSTTNL
jgi:hypothetical protein